MTTVGIIGNGFVGKATARVFLEHAEVRTYDIEPRLATHTMEEVIQSDYVFVCVPTPMRQPQKGYFGCDMSYVRQAVDKITTLGVAEDTVVALKSTVPVGATELLAEEFGLTQLVHHPEFLTARCALVDAQTPARNIVGHTRYENSEAASRRLCKLLTERFPGVPCYVCRSDCSELAKLACNSLFATKVAFFNELRQFAEVLGVSWGDLRKLMLSDGRIAHAHTAVPGPDGRYGFGGTCLPKDLANLIECFAGKWVDSPVLSAVWERNRRDRYKHTTVPDENVPPPVE